MTRPASCALLLLAATLPSLPACRSAAKDDTTPRRVVTFGDSTTAPRKGVTVYTDLLTDWAAQRGEAWEFINAGVPGNTTAMARQRFETDVLERRPDVVVIQFGINDSAVDVWQDPPRTEPRVAIDDYASNLAHFVESARAQGAQVILMTPNPLCWTDRLRKLYNKPPYDVDVPDGMNVLLSAYADRVRAVAAQLGTPWVDVDSAYRRHAQATGGYCDLLLDGMHPNDAGHRLVFDLLLPPLREVTRGRRATGQ